MAKENAKSIGPTWIHGIGSSQVIDTAGEIVDLAGLDCSSLIGGAFNWEHSQTNVPASIVGKVLEYKKIYSEADCENEHHKYFWDKCKVPYLYVMGRLFDDKKPSAKEAAALFIDDAEHPHEPPSIGFSIEGSKINKTGIIVDKSIARRVTCTGAPANKTCIAEMVKNPNLKQEKDADSIFKSESTYTIEIFQPLNKAEVPGSKIPAAHPKMPEKSTPLKFAPGWGHSGGGSFSHPEHGVVTVTKQPNNEWHVKHSGTIAGVGGKKGVFNNAKEAGAHAGKYMRGLTSEKTFSPKMHNRPSPQMPKMDKAITGHERGVHLPVADKKQQGTSVMGTHVRKPMPGYSEQAAKIHAKVTHREMKQIKPNLPKSENIDKGWKEKAIGATMAGVAALGGAKAHGQEFPNKLNPKASVKTGQVTESTNYDRSGKFKAQGHGSPTFNERQFGPYKVRTSIEGYGTDYSGSNLTHNVELPHDQKPDPKMAQRIGKELGVHPDNIHKLKPGGNFVYNANKIGENATPPEYKTPTGYKKVGKSQDMAKALTAGSGMGAPGTLTGGAALGKESLDKKLKKSTAVLRGAEEYQRWEKREEFETFMTKNMPNLTKGEIRAIGQALCLQKSLKNEKKLAKLMAGDNISSFIDPTKGR